MKTYTALALGLLFTLPSMTAFASSPVPVATDSRIKTFVYSENDVFNVVAHYGYQSNIEFPATEQIETISVGNRMGWQIVTAGRRMFIRPTLANARTNMTVVTSKRAYQFDLTAVPAVYSPNEELAYVIRFYYPDDKKNKVAQAAYMDDMSDDAIPGDSGMGSAKASDGNNYNYTYTGDGTVSPLKVYDNGSATYFKFSGSDAPKIYMVNGEGKEVELASHAEKEFVVVDTVSAQFVVRQGGAKACIYNEAYAK